MDLVYAGHRMRDIVTMMQNDGIHPVAEAQSIILDNVWIFLEPMLREASG